MNPGIGDICDRLTILELKLLHAPVDRSTDHFLQERNGLLTKVRATTLNGSWFEHVLALAAVNAKLWALEDQMAEFARVPMPTEGVAIDPVDDRTPVFVAAGIVGMQIRRMNDRRAQLVRQINELTGDQWIEKL